MKDSSEMKFSRRDLLTYLSVAGGVTASGCLGIGERSQSPPSYLIPNLAWDTEIQGGVIASPVISGKNLYVGSKDGYVYAFGEKDSKSSEASGSNTRMFKYDAAGTNAPDDEGPKGDIVERWKFPTNGRVLSSPAVVDGTVYFGSEDNYLYAVSSENGEEVWRFDTGRRMGGGGSPAVVDNTVYVTTGHSSGGGMSDIGEDGGVHAVDASSGEELWSVNRPKGIQSPPVVHDGVLYHGCQDESFYALDADTGEEIWSFKAEAIFCGNRAAVHNGVVYAGAMDNRMYALDANTGDKIWEFKVGSIVVSSAAATNDAIYFGTHDTNLYSVDPKTGEEIWSFETGSHVFSSPAYRNGIVYVTSMDGNLYAVDGETGNPIWLHQVQDGNGVNPVVTEDMVYLGTSGNKVYAVEKTPVGKEEYKDYRTEIADIIEKTQEGSSFAKEVYGEEFDEVYSPPTNNGTSEE